RRHGHNPGRRRTPRALRRRESRQTMSRKSGRGPGRRRRRAVSPAPLAPGWAPGHGGGRGPSIRHTAAGDGRAPVRAASVRLALLPSQASVPPVRISPRRHGDTERNGRWKAIPKSGGGLLLLRAYRFYRGVESCRPYFFRSGGVRVPAPFPVTHSILSAKALSAV